jgi:hypothetical protein
VNTTFDKSSMDLEISAISVVFHSSKNYLKTKVAYLLISCVGVNSSVLSRFYVLIFQLFWHVVGVNFCIGLSFVAFHYERFLFLFFSS